jgi:hypothetical protein
MWRCPPWSWTTASGQRGYPEQTSDGAAPNRARCHEHTIDLAGVDGHARVQDTSGVRDGAPGAGGPGAGGPDFTEAAEVLGVTVDELLDALGPPPPDLEAAAATLGVTMEELQAALPPQAPSTEAVQSHLELLHEYTDF